MSLFTLTLPEDETPSTTIEEVPPVEEEVPPIEEEIVPVDNIEDEETKLTSLSSIKDSETSDMKMHAEDLGPEVIDSGSYHMSDILWGGDIKNCVGGNRAEAPPPNFMILQQSENDYIVFMYCLDEQLGNFYQFLTTLEAGNTVTLHFFDLSFHDSITIQSAIKNSKALIKTKMYMCDADQATASLFFTWMTGHYLEPIPYGIIALTEPLSPFSHAGSSKINARQNYNAIDSSIKQNWYNYAIELGLLTMEEMASLNEGKVVFIEDINTRIANANIKKGKLNEP